MVGKDEWRSYVQCRTQQADHEETIPAVHGLSFIIDHFQGPAARDHGEPNGRFPWGMRRRIRRR
jgi:hypothetical protein